MVHDHVRVYLIYKHGPLTKYIVRLNYYLAGDNLPNARLIFDVNSQFKLYKLSLRWIYLF
jgi:hypothetical protein